jgi:hypothetical protein
VAAIHWTRKELVDDRSQGVRLAAMHALTRYWTVVIALIPPRPGFSCDRG